MHISTANPIVGEWDFLAFIDYYWLDLNLTVTELCSVHVYEMSNKSGFL